jgi:hypothetical protein
MIASLHKSTLAAGLQYIGQCRANCEGPDRHEINLQLRASNRPGEVWLQVLLLNAVKKDDVHAAALQKQHYRKSGRPDYFPKESRTEPVAVAFNRIPADRNADTLIDELWDTDGLWTLLIKPSKSESVLYAGSAVPAQAELASGSG